MWGTASKCEQLPATPTEGLCLGAEHILVVLGTRTCAIISLAFRVMVFDHNEASRQCRKIGQQYLRDVAEGLECQEKL
jgi:hypothetical protein